MGKIYMLPAGGGVSSEDVTASVAEVLKGYTALTKDSGDEPAQGTLELTGNAGAGQVLSGYTFYSTNPKSKQTGTMPNRGALNWSGSNTTYSVPAGCYSGGTLDSRPSYNNGYNAGVSAADNRVNTNSQSYKSGYNAGVAAKTSQYKTGDWTLTRAGFLNLGFQPNVFMLIVGDDLHGTPMGMYCNLGGLAINHMEGPSNTHLSDIFYVNGNGIGLNDRSLSYVNNKYTRYIAARIV